MRPSVGSACFLALAALPARAGELGACGDGRGIQSIVASSSTGAAVGSGIERGVVVYLRGLSKADERVIDMPYGAGLFAEPGGGRFALLKNASVHLYSFAGFQRISKSSVKVLKDQSTLAWRWIEGTDDIAVFSQTVKSGPFDMGESKKTPHLLRFNVTTGAGTQVPLQIPKDFLSAAFDAKGERVAVGFWDGHVEVRSAMDGGLVASFTGHDSGSSAIGLAFHPRQNLVASSEGNKVILFDLDTKSIHSTKPSEDGTKLLQYVADGQFLIGASVFNISLLDPEGRRLQTVHSEDGYDDYYVADPLRKVFSVRENLVCWHTFEPWQKVPVTEKTGKN